MNGTGTGGRGLKDVLLPGRGERLLPAASALLLVVSFPPLHLLIPPFVALVPFAVWVHGLPPGRAGARAAARGAALLGLVYFGLLVYWILVALVTFTPFAVPAYLGVLGLLVLIAASFGWSFHRLTHRANVPLWLALPLAWTAAEWLQGTLGDLSFPWLGLGSTLTGFPELVGVAELVGARGVSFWIALANGLLAVGILHRRDAHRWSGAIPAFLLVVLLPMSWGVWRAGALEMRPVGDIAVVQPNIPEEVKLDRDEVVAVTLAALEAVMPRLESPVPVVVWPEVTFPEVVRDGDQAALRERVQAMAVASESEILFGAYGVSFPDGVAGGDGMEERAGAGVGNSEGERPTIHNSAFVMTPAGLSDYEYAKRNLVPVIERVPFVQPDWFGDLGYYGALGRGEGRSPGTAGGIDFGVLICFESIFAEASRHFRLAGAEVLVNITNDAWYGRDSWYGRTTALWQHPAHMVMRAIENRMGVARSANTGISLFIDPVGRVYGRTPLFEPALSRATVYTTDVTTLYTRMGDIAGKGAALVTFLLLASVWWRGRGAGAPGRSEGRSGGFGGRWPRGRRRE